VVGPGSNYILNTTHDRSLSSFKVDNLIIIGDYDVTVTDSNGCVQTITVTVPTSAPDNLGATAIVETASGCSLETFSDGNTGASIKITSFDKGDGDVAGYPLWQRQTQVDLNSFTIALNGTITGADLTSIGVNIDGTSIDATSTASVTNIQDIASNLASNINQQPNYSATLNGSSIQVKGAIIDAVLSLTSSTTTATLRISVSNITQIAETAWVEVPGLAGQEVASDLQAGSYRAIIRDGSGCGGTLVQNTSQGGSIFRIDAPQSLQFKDIEFDEITCTVTTSNLTFKLSNGTYELVPDPSVFELTLNSNVLRSTVDGTISFTTGTVTTTTVTTTTVTPTASVQVTGNSYTPNLRTNLVTIESLATGDYELVVKNIQTECVIVLNFSIEEPSGISYTGDTDFVIDPCYETYQDIFFDQFLIEGGTPFTNLAGESFYNLSWTVYPDDPTIPVATINAISTAINFAPYPGRYEVMITDKNGCLIQDETGSATPIEFTFSKELSSLTINGIGGATGDQLSTPVSCEIDSQDGQVNIEVISSDPNIPISPYEIRWEKQTTSDVVFEQKLLLEGVAAGDSLEVYSIKLNGQALTYTTQVQDEPKASVVNEFTQIINATQQFSATVDPVNNPFEIIIRSTSQASLELEIITKNTRLALVNSSSGIADWTPLDGSNGNPNYTGYLNLSGLEEGLYRYTITAVNVAQCVNNAAPDQVQGVITVENENVLEIREGPLVDEFLCNGQSGTLFVDVFDGNTGPLTFFYNNAPATFDIVGTNQYLINISNPVETAILEIYNGANCGISREITIGNGEPLFDFDSVNFQQSATFLAREDITFSDLSENEYDSFEFIYGDGTQSELLERNSPEPIIHEYAISGSYFVTLRIYNDLGCTEELSKTIRIGKGYSILVPNVFTPNGDIWNSTFKPIFNGLSEITLRIYDSTGGLIYQEEGAVGSNPNTPGISLIGWTGLDLETFAPYYIYTITGKTIDNEDILRDGTFIILR